MRAVTQLIALLASLLILTSTHADPPPFTITVPLALNNLPPEVTNFTVSCIVQSGPSGIDGRGIVSGRISSGSYHGDLTVPVNLTGAFADPSRIDRYRCSLQLSGTLDGRSVVFMSDAALRFPLAAGAPYQRDTRDQRLP